MVVLQCEAWELHTIINAVIMGGEKYTGTRSEWSLGSRMTIIILAQGKQMLCSRSDRWDVVKGN